MKKRLLFLLVPLGAAPLAFSQQVQPTAAQFMHAVLDLSGNLYVAAYDANEVWRVDTAVTPVSAAAKVPVGKGPIALALSADGRFIACANYLGHSISLLRPPDLELVATLECPKGPSQLAALPDGRFAVACGFSDSVVVIDPESPSETVHLDTVGTAPSGIAAVEQWLAVGMRQPAVLAIYSLRNLQETRHVSLDEPPAHLVALASGRFVAALASKVIAVDPSNGSITAQAPLAAKSLVSDGACAFALTSSSIIELDEGLQTRNEIPVPLSGTALAVSRNNLMVLSAKTRQCWLSAAPLPPPAQIVALPEPAQPAPSPKEVTVPLATQPVPIPEPEPAPPPAEPAAPKEVARPPAAPATDVVKAPGESPKAQPVSEQGKKEAFPKYRVMPAIVPEVRAPRPGRRPSPSPLEDVGQHKRIEEGLTEGLNIQPQQSFTPPDWTQPLRDIEFDMAEGDINQMTDEMLLSGNVKLHLDTLDFAADKFWYSKSLGQMMAEGRVLIRQGPASLEAQKVSYTLPDESKLAVPSRLAPAQSEQDHAKLRLQSGNLEAYDVHILQPDQELFADEVRYNFADSTGHLSDARGRAGIYHFCGQTLRILGPASFDGEDIWITTCDKDPPHYKIRMSKASIREGKAVYASDARLELGNFSTPLYWPRWGYKPGQTGSPVSFDFDSGHRAKLGYYVNVGQQFVVSPDARLGLRLYPTTKEGVGFGIDGDYDYTQTPASPLFLGKGEFRTLYTTEDRGYIELYHRHDLFKDTVMLMQVEHWSDRDFYKDFYYDEYRNRTGPRSFINITRTKPGYIATATVRSDTHNFVVDTERLPELTYHLLQRRLADNFYFSFDTINGYNVREPWDTHAVRLANVGRLTYDVNVNQGLGLTPFAEMLATYYSDGRSNEQSDVLLAETLGVTLQARAHRVYPGFWGFSSFKHIVVPSITYSYRPEPSMGVHETPRFDSYDVAHGRSRIETKLDNIVLGRDEKSDEVWQVARLTLYQGNDFWNEISEAEDYEAELDLRPRPWWGWMLAAERHTLEEEIDLSEPYWLQTISLEIREMLSGETYDEALTQYDPRFGHYNRILTYLYYEDQQHESKFNSHVGFDYTETRNSVFNREILYGAGYQIGEFWGVGFEHRYDLDSDELTQQTYEIRRNLHCWEAALQFRDRHEGWDIGVSFNIVAFPGTKLKF